MSVPNRVGVLGGGRMGAGIAHSFLAAGSHVTVVEVNEDALAAARERLVHAIQGTLDRGGSGTVDSWLENVTLTTDAAEFAEATLVVEAVPESLELKSEAFRSIADHNPTAVIATNTSSLPVGTLAETVDNDVIGLHFFNPVPASKLVEIITTPQTTADLVDQAKTWVEGLGKTPVVVTDSPGFASSRLGVAIALEAVRMVEEGVASPEDIDTAMVLGYKFPVGPLKLTDIVGLDVRLAIAEYLESTLGERFAPPQLLKDKVARGELGAKAGKGFYDYD